MTNACPPAYTILCAQLIVGVFLQTMLAGIVVAKVLRPKKRKQVRSHVVVHYLDLLGDCHAIPGLLRVVLLHQYQLVLTFSGDEVLKNGRDRTCG